MEGRPLEDRELVAKSIAGDRGAFDELVRRYQKVALRVAYLIIGDAADAEGPGDRDRRVGALTVAADTGA